MTAPSAASAEASPREAQRATMAAYEAAWRAHDPQRAAAAYTEDAVVAMAGAPPVSGRAAIEGLLASMFAGSDDARVPFVRTFWSGNVMIGEWVWAGTQSGEMLGVPATGRPFGLRGVTIYQFSPDGRIEQARLYFDVATLLAQLGVSPQKARAVQPLPTGEAPSTEAAGTAAEQRNVSAVEKMTAAFAMKDEDGFVAAFTEEVVWDDETRPAPMNGRDATRSAFRQMVTAFPDATITAHNMWGVGDYVIYESTMTATHKGALGPIAATNRPVELHSLDVIQFTADGKIARAWTYGNSVELLAQLGLLPGPAN